MLDFVPNHTALDHPWVEEHPEYYITGTDQDLARAPKNYTLVQRTHGALILAHGRDPNYPGWPDTLQLNGAWQLRDLVGAAVYDRNGNELRTRGFYQDAPPWQAAVFAMTRRE